MLNYLWAGMMALGILWGAFHGNLAQVTNGALDSAREAVTLCLTMLGIMSFWCGILKVGEEAGLIEALTKKNEAGGSGFYFRICRRTIRRRPISPPI